MTVPSYTEEDVELVAEATEQHHIEFGITDAMGNNPCSCGQWWDAAGDNPGWDQHMAEVALAALAAAGRLLPPGSEREEEWTMRYKLNGKERLAEDDGHVFDARAAAEQHIQAWRQHFPQLTYSDVEYLRRDAITTPWSPVPDTNQEG